MCVFNFCNYFIIFFFHLSSAVSTSTFSVGEVESTDELSLVFKAGLMSTLLALDVAEGVFFQLLQVVLRV